MHVIDASSDLRWVIVCRETLLTATCDLVVHWTAVASRWLMGKAKLVGATG